MQSTGRGGGPHPKGTSIACETPWFSDLIGGRGPAASLPSGLREALGVATEKPAEEQANKERVQRAAEAEAEAKERKARDDRERSAILRNVGLVALWWFGIGIPAALIVSASGDGAASEMAPVIEYGLVAVVVTGLLNRASAARGGSGSLAGWPSLRAAGIGVFFGGMLGGATTWNYDSTMVASIALRFAAPGAAVGVLAHVAYGYVRLHPSVAPAQNWSLGLRAAHRMRWPIMVLGFLVLYLAYGQLWADGVARIEATTSSPFERWIFADAGAYGDLYSRYRWLNWREASGVSAVAWGLFLAAVAIVILRAWVLAAHGAHLAKESSRRSVANRITLGAVILGVVACTAQAPFLVPLPGVVVLAVVGIVYAVVGLLIAAVVIAILIGLIGLAFSS